ncbi:MAG TPA: AAA family ATPase [Thermoplasmata archaeon]|nr:AAA family ATPase [Thermoplasmata archaeon]
MSPLLIVFAGLPATGKSTLSREVAVRQDAVWLRVDTFEAALVKAGLARPSEMGLAGYLLLRDVAAVQLELGRTVVVDAVNGDEESRELWRSLAMELRLNLMVVEVTCSDPLEHRARVERRLPATPPLPAPTWSQVVQREYRPWSEPTLTVDSALPVEENVERILSNLPRNAL